MSRNNHASFSSRNKSNLQVLKNKFKIKAIKGVLKRTEESRKDEKVTRKKDKLRKRFWWKWLSFIRGHRPDDEDLGHDVRVHPKAVAEASKERHEERETCDESMDVIEIPIERGQKISKILIEPTRTGIKAMIAHRRKPRHPGPQTPPQTDTTSEDEDPRWTTMALGQSDGRLSGHGAEAHKKSQKMRTLKNEGGGFPRTSEGSLTSALFVRKNINDIVESAAFIEPTLPNDYADSKKSDDLSQESTKINKRRISYRILGDKSEEIRQAGKTVSEPTWIEKKDIFRRRRLQDNINDLLEQFLFLEADDVMGLTVPRLSGPATGVKTIRLDAASCFGTGEDSVKDICREVSPEILVNIKPFKEYLSDDQLERSTPLERGREKSNLQSVSGQIQTGKVKKCETVERAEEYIYPALKGVLMSKENYSTHVLRNFSGNKDVWQASSTKPCVEELAPVCTVRGLCKTYSASRERNNWEETEKVLKSESLDDFLKTLDDSDHDVMFQKNIAQFRKKVNIVPRLDFKKSLSGAVDARKREYKKAKKSQNFLEFARPIVECVAEESLEEGDWEKRHMRQMGAMALRSQKDWWKSGQMWSKTLLTNVMLLTERNLVRRALATRMEEVMVNVAATRREMHSVVESGRCTVMQVERAGICGERWALKKGSVSSRGRNFDVVSRILRLQPEDFSFVRARDVAVLGEAIPEALSYILSTSKCINVMQRTLLRSYQGTSVCYPKNLTPVEKSSTISRGNPKEEVDANARRNYVLLSSDLPCGPAGEVDILGSATFEYVANIDDSETAVSLESPSSPFHFASISEMISLSSVIEGLDLEKPNGSQIDGFQILYNNVKDDLNDDDEDTSKAGSAKSLIGSKGIVDFVAEDLGVIGEKEIEKEKNMLFDENKVNRFLKYKSSSSPKENIIQNEFGPHEPSSRLRRSLNLSREFEKDLQLGKKRILSAEFRLESHSASSKVGQARSFVQTGESKFGTLMVSSELKPKGSTEKYKTRPSSDGAGINVRKEVVAAFNSIKEMSAGKGETRGGTKRMSLVIMLCKK